ncbi:UNVERIFIED_CONTAM: hypothetical protein FKN15_036935 [Acipenser sinensis]
MKDPCRICGGKFRGNQCRWIFSSSGKRNLQVILSYVLGVTFTRDGKGEFLCSKCVFMLENVVNYDVIIGRLQGACSLKVQKLLTEKDNLAQCISHIYNRNNPRPIKSNGEYLSIEKPPVTFNTGIPEEGTLEADSCSGSINPGKDVAAASSTASEGNKMKRCPSSETLQGHEQSGCPNPRRSGSGSPFKTSYLKPVHSRSQSICFNLVQRTCSTPGSFHSQSSSLQSSCAESCSLACSSTSLSVLGLKTKGAHRFDNFSELLARSSFISSPSVCDAIKLLKSVQCKPLLILPESKIPVLLKYAQRRPASGCSYLYRKSHDTERSNDWKFLQDLAEDFNDEYTPLNAESLAEKHKELSNLEAATRQLTGDLENTRMTIDTLKKRLEEADEDNKNLNGRLEERVNELALEKKNSLKRDKTIQGLSLVLKDKDKEIEELCHEIEDRDNALVKAREAAHKAQIQKYQGAEEHQSLLTEKEVELAKLLSDHHTNTMENQKLQRALGRRVQELSDLNQTKEQLEKELEDMQELKNKGDKDVNDLRNQLKKLNGEMAEKEHALEQQYQALLSESKQKVQSQEITIKRLTSSLNEKDQLLQEYLNMAKDADQERNRSPDGRDAMLAKLRERLKEKEKALEQAIDEKFAAIEEKDNEIRQLQLSLREKERDLERLNNRLSHNEETINSFDSVIKEKDVELQHLVNSCKNLQRAKQELEDNLARALREKDAIISQLQQSLANKNKDLEEMANTLLNQTQSNVRDLTEQLRQRLKVTETMLAEAMKDKERLVSENQNAVEGLLATVGSKDQLLKESAEHYNRTLAERNLEIQDLRRHLSEKKHEVSILEKHSSVITHEKYIETAELKVLLTEKDTIINKLVESGQERDKYLAELKMQEAPVPQVLELKQTIQILQEQLEEKEAELTQKKGDVNVAKIPIIKKSAVTLKKELAQKTDDLNKALKKENELQIEVAELRSLLADLENRHEAQAANIESLTKTLDVKDELIRDLHTRLGKPPKHNGVELQTQRGMVTREGMQSPGILQRESTIIGGNSQQEALPALQTVLSEYEALNKALKAEQQLYSSLVRTVKEPDSAQRIHNLQMELTAVQLLRQKLEEGIRSNEDLRKDLEKELQRTKRKEVTDAQTGLIDPREMETLKHQLEDAQRWNTSLQARLGKIQGRGGGVGGTNDTSDTFSFTGDQTSYMSIYLGEHDELEGDIENLSLPELRRKVQELLEYVKELQAFNKDLQNKASLTENSVEQDKQDILTLSSQNKLLEKKLADAVKTNKAIHDQLNREGQKSAQNVIKPQVKDQKIQTSPEKERNSKASPQGNRAEHQGNKSSGIKPPGRKESTSASPDSEKTELDLEDQNVVESELKETSCRMETIGKELKTAEKPPFKDEGNNQNMEMEIASLRALLTETGSASVIELRNELARLHNENTNLQSILKEMQSTEFKESCDDSGDGEIKKDLKKVVKRLKTELMDARKIIKLLKEQLELNSSMDSESSFNPDLIVSMAKEIDRLKKEHEASTKRRVILEKMLKEMEAQQPRGIDERDQRRNSQETLQRQEARIHSTPGSTIGAKSRLPVPVKSSKAAGNNNNNGANQNTEPDPQVEKLQSALQEKNKEYRELQESLCTAEFTLTCQKVNKTEATQTTDPSTDFNLYNKIDQLQKALQEKNQLYKELQELLCKAESALASQNTDRTAGTFLEQDDKEVQVDLQDLGYETCGKSENEVDREENRSTDNDNQIKQHMNEASLPSLLKRDGQFFSMDNLDTNSSTSYPSSPCLSSPKISMKSLQIYDDYGFTDDSGELKQQVMELKTKLENYQRVIHHLQSLLRRNSLSSDLLTIGSEPGQQTTVKLQEEHGDLEKDGQEMCSHKSLGLFSQDHSQNGSFPLGHADEDKQMLKDEITSLKIELDKEKASNKNLLEQLHQLQSKIRSASPARFDSLVQSQARELSHLRQKIKDSRSLGTLHHHQLEDLNKSFEELLQASDVDYYVGKAFRGQLDKSLLVLGKLEERLECGDGYSDNEDNTLLEFAERESFSFSLVSPESLKHEITYLRKQLDSERRQLQKQLKDLARHNQNLAQATEEQLDVLSQEVQEKNKVIQQLQLQVRNQSVELSTSHNSSDSEASDRYSRRILDSGSDTLHALQCRDGKYGQGRTSAALIIANNPCRLSQEVQEKNKVIQQLQLQVRNQSVELSTSHNSSDSEASDRYSRRILDSGSDTLHALQCRDGKYGQGRTSAGTKVPYGLQVEETAQPPGIISASTGKATVLENGGGSRRQSQTLLSTNTQILENKDGLAQQQRLQGLQRENSLLQEKLKNSEQLNETLRTEVDLHRSIINNREDAGEERGLSPKPLDRSSREDRASTGLTESRNELSGLLNTASTNIFIHGSEEQGQLANEVHFLWRQNQTLKDHLSLGSRDKQKENEKLRESLAKRNSKLEYLRNEYEHVKKEAVRLENKFRGSLEENKHLKEALHHSRDEINRLQSEIGIQRQQLSDSQHLLQSLRVELQVYEQLKVASDKRTVSDATSGQTQDASAPSHGPLDLSELLSEIRHLRIQLERSIQTNNALRQRLEEQLLRGQGKVEGSPSTININYLLSGEQRHSALSNYGDKSPAQVENFPHPSYRGPSKSGRSPPNRDGAEELHSVPEMKPHPTDELDSASQCSGSSADSTTHTPSRLVPGHRLWASRSGRHMLGLIEDYNALRKQISEGKELTCGMENNLQECFHAISQQGTESMVLDQRFLKGFSSDVNTMQQILEEASRLLKLLWKVSLPTNTSNSSSQNRQDEMMKTEIARLRSKLSQQERMLNGTVKRLRSTNRLKEGMEKVIIDQCEQLQVVLRCFLM